MIAKTARPRGRLQAMSNVIVIGCGRVGSQLANMLSDNGDNVCCIDKSPDSFANLGRNFNGMTIQGVGFDEEVLEKAGIEDCDVVAAVTQHDNANLMCAEVASRIFGVEHVIARLYNSSRKNAYNQIGIDYVCGTSLVADGIFSKIVSGHGSHVTTFGDCEVIEFSLALPDDARYYEDGSEDDDDAPRDDGPASRNEAPARRSIRVGDLERDHELRIIAFERADGLSSSIPTRDSVLYTGDTILACVKLEALGDLAKYMQD